MIYIAEVINLNDEIEEEVVLRINDIEITCFVSICLFLIEKHMTYQVQIMPVIFHNYVVYEVPEETKPLIEKEGDSFIYNCIGRLIGNQLDINFIILEDDILLRDFSYLDGKMIAWKVDRIDVEFITQSNSAG